MAIIRFDFSENSLQCSVLEVHIKVWRHVISGKLDKWLETNGIMKQNFFKLEKSAYIVYI